jgi:hypothetical protein
MGFFRLRHSAKGCRVSGVTGIAQASALNLPLGKCSACALGYEATLFLGERRVEMQHEGVGISA